MIDPSDEKNGRQSMLGYLIFIAILTAILYAALWVSWALVDNTSDMTLMEQYLYGSRLRWKEFSIIIAVGIIAFNFMRANK